MAFSVSDSVSVSVSDSVSVSVSDSVSDYKGTATPILIGEYGNTGTASRTITP